MNIKTEQRLVASRIKRFHLRLFLNISFVFWTHSLKTVYNVKVTQYHWPISRHFYKGNDLCDFRFAFLQPHKKFGLWGGYRGGACWVGMGVGCLMHLVDFLSLFRKGTTFVASCSHSCISSRFWKGFCSKRKEFAPNWKQILSFLAQTPFQKGAKQFW